MAKLAIFLPSLDGGGAERVTIILANALAKRGHEVHLVAANANGVYLSEVSETVRVIGLNKRRVITSLPALVAYLRRERPKALLSGLGHANIIAILARRLAFLPVRLAVTEHNSILRGLSSPKGRVIRWLMRRIYRYTDAIICVSKGIEREMIDLLALPPAKLCTIYNPVDIDGIRRLAAGRPDHPWFAPGQPPVIISVGRLTEQKDFPTLLKAFSELRRNRLARLIILGEGADRASLAELATNLGIADDLAMPGFQKNPFVWMAASALYVMSSAWEGLPGVLLEAMACGTPVVSTDCRTGPSEILEGGKWGQLVPVGDAHALAIAMAAALAAPARPDVTARMDAFRIQRATAIYEAVLLD